MKSKGLGDSVEKFTKATGIKKVVDTVSKATGKPCGCGQRRDNLNRMFPYYAIQSEIGVYLDLNHIYLCLKFQTSSPKNGRDIEVNV